jgi:hypothetical protein
MICPHCGGELAIVKGGPVFVPTPLPDPNYTAAPSTLTIEPFLGFPQHDNHGEHGDADLLAGP